LFGLQRQKVVLAYLLVSLAKQATLPRKTCSRTIENEMFTMQCVLWPGGLHAK